MSPDDPTHDRSGDAESTTPGQPAPPPGTGPGGHRSGGDAGPVGPRVPEAPDPGGDTDEVASALLDGLLGDDDAAVAWRRPEVRARVGQLGVTRDRVRDVPPPLDPAARERALAAALAAFDEDADTAGPAPGVLPAAVAPAAGRESPPASLAGHRARRARRQGPPRWLSAAAAVVVVAAVGAALAAIGSRTGGDSDDVASDAATQDESLADDGAATSEEADEGAESGNDAAAGSGPSAAESGGDGAAMLPVGELGDLGTFASAADLVDRVRDDRTRFDADATTGEAEAHVEAQRTAERALADGGISCEPLPDALAAPGVVVRSSGTASLDGDRVSVLVAVDPTGDLRVVVVDSGCEIRADDPL